MKPLLLIFLGGGTGACARYGLSLWVKHAVSSEHLFLGTMACNILGCFVIGCVAAAVAGPMDEQPLIRSLIVVGFLGGFTTFSSFSLETIHLVQAQRSVLAGVHVAVTLAACLIGTVLGSQLVHWTRRALG